MRLGHPKPSPRIKAPKPVKPRKPLPKAKPGKKPKKPVSKHMHPEWRKKRARVLRRDKHWCRGCDQQAATEVHHAGGYGRGRGVKSLIDIPDESLISLCHRCHAEIHPWMKEER